MKIEDGGFKIAIAIWRAGDVSSRCISAAIENTLFNLILALVWFAVGLVFFAWPLLGLPPLRFSGMGWLCLVLCAYNMVRWWAGRLSAFNQKPLDLRPRGYHPEGSPDPNFDFSDQLFPQKSAAITRPEDPVKTAPAPEEKKPGQGATPPTNQDGSK